MSSLRLLGCLIVTVLLAPASNVVAGAEGVPKKVLVVVEGATSLKNYAVADGRQLATLLGHFNVRTKVLGVQEYRRGELSNHDLIFYIGFHRRNPVPEGFTGDVLATAKPVIWLNTGFREFSSLPGFKARFGFTVTRLDTSTGYTGVRMGGVSVGKGEPNLNIIDIVDRKKVEVLATAVPGHGGKEVPYIVRSGNLMYFGDSPFASAGEADRYILFADMLHDILGEQHEASHSAILRIEDINPMDDPNKLREIADILSARGIPFLVGVSPFYVNPAEGLRISLSDKPELADALRYMVENGGTIVMHGVTHQYKGVTGSDYEFWDESTNGPIRDETVDGISRKLEMGIQEMMRNRLYPMIWETPHYTASFRLYQTIAKYFSTAMEQRLAIEDADYTQFFPYVIRRDLFGQTIYPENLGYVPQDSDREKSRAAVQAIIAGARAGLRVRDGFASCFFHSFLDLSLLEELVDGVRALGYEYVDLRDSTHWVKTRDRIILTGTQEYTLTLQEQYLSETWFEPNGEIARNVVSEERINGPVTRRVDLQPGAFYKAEPAEYRERKQTLVEAVTSGAERILQGVLGKEEEWKEARPLLLWNHHARGSAYNDQASFAGALGSINLAVDTMFVGQRIDLSRANLLVVPSGVVDSLGPGDFDAITRFVQDGGNLVTDGPNDLVENFGMVFGSTRLRVSRIRDRIFPDERIRWKDFGLLKKFETRDLDEVLAIDEESETPVVIGRKWGKGRVLYFGTLFDPSSQIGTSRYPYFLEYVRRYFRLGPIVRREDLEVYFDPGYRRTISTESLVKQWVRQGIRIIHAAGWHKYPKYTYDYERLIRLAHANGILVYAWLEPPQVSQKFWLEHPQWREKNYKGEDARPSWRYPVALTDRQCVAALTEEFRDLLERYDWDGVNLAELYFEAAKGFQDPQHYTPMHPSARQELRSRYGIDLAGVFDPRSESYWYGNPAVVRALTEYRVRKLEEVYDILLKMIRQVGEKKTGFEVIVTAMDSFGSPELREYIGVDMSSILSLQRKHGFLLQVEDPEHLWSTDPRRYIDIGARYAALTGDRSKILLDLNIVSVRKPDAVTPFPTLIQTGTESFHLVRAASLGAPRLTVYSESSINPQDLIFLPYALASGVEYRFGPNGYSVNTPYSITMKLPPDVKQIELDGRPLSPSRENLYLIPSGRHEISLSVDPAGAFSTHALDTHILSMTGNVLSVAYAMRSLDVTYESSTRTLMALNREPTSVVVDGQRIEFTAMKGNDCYTVFLPPGRHRAEITAGDVFTYGVNLTSLWSTTAIAMFGAAAVLLLLGMYFVLKVMRRRATALSDLP